MASKTREENIRKVWDISTAHLPEHLGTEGLSAEAGVVCDRLEYGWLMWVPDDPIVHARDLEGVPVEVLWIQMEARRLGCDFVRFDADADADPELPVYAW